MVSGVERLIGGIAVVGTAAGGAILMDWLAPGGFSAGFGLIAGGVFGSIAVIIHKIAEMKLVGLVSIFR